MVGTAPAAAPSINDLLEIRYELEDCFENNTVRELYMSVPCDA